MSETETPSDIQKLTAKVDEMIAGHKRATDDELAKLARALREELSDAKKATSDATQSEIKALRESLEDISGYIKERRDADKEKERVKENETTIVVPPDDVTVPDVPPEPEPVHGDEPGKRSLFKRLW